jgi:hypothetical protein
MVMKRLLLVAVVILLRVAVAAPDRFIQAEVLGVHGGATFGPNDPASGSPVTGWFRVPCLKATFIADRLRAGATALEIIDWKFGFGSVTAFAPVHVGYNLLLKPEKSAVGYHLVPACYVEAAAGYAYYYGNVLYTRITAAAEADWYGLGLGVEAGGVYLLGIDAQREFAGEPQPRAYAAVKVRLLTATFGF